MKSLGIKNIGGLVSGDLDAGMVDANSIICENGFVTQIGRDLDLSGADTVVDTQGTTVIPGLIDSHCHVVLGDYTPRQKQVDFLDSYVHGGITSVVSAGEGVHVPGRPHDASAVKGLAIAAAKCFENFRPNGMKINGGCLVLEPGLTEDDFDEMVASGVRFAKYGFGDYSDTCDGEADIRRAQEHGIRVMAHSGGTYIPGSRPIDHEMLLLLRPDICGHVNGGTTSLDDEGLVRLVQESDMGLQIVQAGNLRSALHLLRITREMGLLRRVCVGSDTPTGTGVMPLGIMKTICELSSLGSLTPQVAIALATGNNARLFGLKSGVIAPGWPADLLVVDAPVGSQATGALTAIARGDIPGISCVIINGEVVVGQSRNTPLAQNLATFEGISLTHSAD
jgi:enamidase